MHMRMKGHCMMPFEDDSEFEPFYDFSRLYKNMGLNMKSLTNESESDRQKNEEQKIQKEQRLA